MFKKRTSYEVNVQGITFWRKKINVDNTEVFVRECLNDPFMLYLDKARRRLFLAIWYCSLWASSVPKPLSSRPSDELPETAKAT